MPVAPLTKHPAKYSEPILALIARLVAEETARVGRRLRVLDPFAGVGRVHDLDADTFAGELEVEWAACRRPTVVADAAAPPWRPASFDVIATSPCYGNRLRDAHVNRDSHKACKGEGCSKCKWTGIAPRRSYTHDLGHRPRPESTATMAFGPAYREKHQAIYGTWPGLLAAGGLALLNVSNFVERKQEVDTVGWHLGALRRAGLAIEDLYAVPTHRLRNGANYLSRAAAEHVIVARRSR